MDEIFPHTSSSLDRKKAKRKFVVVPADRAPDKMRRALEHIDTVRAIKLRDFVRKQGWSLQSGGEYWEDALAGLRLSLSADCIDGPLDWYIGWWKPGKRPEIRDGKELRKVWNWLFDLFNEHNTTKIEISATAKCICASLGRSSHEERLAEVVQQSLDNYTLFRDKLLAVWKKRDDTSRQEMRTDPVAIRLKMLLHRNALPDARMFVMEWFRSVLGRFPEFGGNWKRFIVSEANDRFMGRVTFLLGEHAKRVLVEIEGKA